MELMHLEILQPLLAVHLNPSCKRPRTADHNYRPTINLFPPWLLTFKHQLIHNCLHPGGDSLGGACNHSMGFASHVPEGNAKHMQPPLSLSSSSELDS